MIPRMENSALAERRRDIVVSLMMPAGFMLYGFVLPYLRDLAPGKEKWIADYAVRRYFESRLAHVHGNLFALINLLVGLVLLAGFLLPKAASPSILWPGSAGLPMAPGIISEVLFSVPSVLLLAGGIATVACMAWLAAAVWRATETEGA